MSITASKGPDVIDNTCRILSAIANPYFGLDWLLSASQFLKISLMEKDFVFQHWQKNIFGRMPEDLTSFVNLRLGSEYGRWSRGFKRRSYKFGPVEGLVRCCSLVKGIMMIEFTLGGDASFQFYQAQNIGDRNPRTWVFDAGKIVHGKNQWIYQAGLTRMILNFRNGIHWESNSNQQVEWSNQRSVQTRFQFPWKHSKNTVPKNCKRVDLGVSARPFYAGVNFSYASHVRAIDKLFELELLSRGVQAFRQEVSITVTDCTMRDLVINWSIFDFQVNVQNDQWDLCAETCADGSAEEFRWEITYTL